MYLQDSFKGGSARFVIEGLTWTSESYKETIKCLKEHYDQPRLEQEEHICSIVYVVPVKSSSGKEVCRLYVAATQHYEVLKAAKNNSFEAVLTVILQQKRDENTQLKWTEFNNDSKNVPPFTEISKIPWSPCKTFWECLSYGTQQASGYDCKWPVKHSFALSTDVTCLAGKKQGHQIHTSSVCKGWIPVDRISVVQEIGFYMSCLRKGHKAERSCAPPMCKKCTTHHYTLWHKDADYLSQKKPKNEEGRRKLMYSGSDC